MTSVTNRVPPGAEDWETRLGQVTRYFCGTSHLTMGVYVGIAGTQSCYQGAVADRYIVIDAGPNGVEFRCAAEARELAEKILALADEYEALAS